MNGYAAAVRQFYDIYRPIARKYGLRMSSHTSIYDDGWIKIYKGEGADAMTRNAVAKLHSDMCGCNEKTLDRIEHALGIKLETWQSEYILSEGITYPYEGRRTGKTLAYQIKTLLIAHNDITIYGNEAQYYVDEIHGSIYEKNYVTDLARLSEHLRKAGIGVPKVTLKLDKMRRREDGMRWN